ncbi:NADH:flavin oxidoreductase/NADH oxidase [Micromonospora sp. DT81.3]|uniref:NADH:flavin oxidoreductase/NADH oxidase n=1 Tax=Micromonospora sp. DT81.3 TaxID=3416523 RepID=UPI003CE733BB
MSILFSPLTLRGTTLRNRLWVSPMCMYSAADGVPQEWHHTHLAQFASGGAGLIVAEATAVSPEGRISPRDTGIWTDEQRNAWAPIVAAIHARGSKAGIQLAHAGRKASTWWPFSGRRGSVAAEDGGWPTLAPSAVAYEGFAEPVALDAAGIDAVVSDFAAATRRSLEAGFEVLEVHGAHGYLLHQFLSPLSNRRDDEYGGSLENRARLLLRVVRAVRDAAGGARAGKPGVWRGSPQEGVPIIVRISATDAADGGFDVDEAAIVAEWAVEAGADLIDVSSGGLVAHQAIEVSPGYQVPLAARIRKTAGVPVTAVGMITDGAHAESVLADGDADAVFVGREWLRDPHFALRAAHELGVEVDYWPEQYQRARWAS